MEVRTKKVATLSDLLWVLWLESTPPLVSEHPSFVPRSSKSNLRGKGKLSWFISLFLGMSRRNL